MDSGMRKSEAAILGHLKAISVDGLALASYRDIGQATGFQNSSVKLAVRRLIKDGLISVSETGVPWKGTTYEVKFADTEAHQPEPVNGSLRVCLRCQKIFMSGGPGNRVCQRCSRKNPGV